MTGFNIPGEEFINSWYPILIALALGLLLGLRNYFRGGQLSSDQKMTGKTVIITGANSGIGLETAKELASRGARVILACRDEEKANTAAEEIKTYSKSKDVVTIKLDLLSFDSIKQFAKTFLKSEERLDVLINNAGIMCNPNEKTVDGYETHLQSNYLGHFLLTHLLLEKLKSCAPSRILNVTALAYQIGQLNPADLNYEKREFKAGDAFSQSKLAVVQFTRQMAKYLEGSNVTCNVVMPGVVNTNHHRHLPFRQNRFLGFFFTPFQYMLMKGAKDGAQTGLYCAVAKEEEGVSGKYYADCQMKDLEPIAMDDKVAQKLWDVSVKMTGVTLIEDDREEEQEEKGDGEGGEEKTEEPQEE